MMYIYIYTHYTYYTYMSPSCSSFKQNPFEHFTITFFIVFLKTGPFFRSLSFQGVPTSRCDLRMANTSPVASLFRVLETEMSLEGGDF